jgi:MoaA/NifB/PqqE/SkfB family radical SAM enzyme
MKGQTACRRATARALAIRTVLVHTLVPTVAVANTMRRFLPILTAAAKTSAQRLIPPGMRLRARHTLSPLHPRQMIIDLAATCNALCPFCPRIYMPPERSKGTMARHVFETCVAEARKHDVRDIRLYSTAEPTLHPDFDEHVATLKREGFVVSVSTNAATLSYHLESLASIDTLQYSIEGWDRESYEKFRYPLKFDRVKRNIVAFWEHAQKVKTRPLITSNLLLTKSTDIEAYVECWGPYVDRITVGFLMGTTRLKDGVFISELNEEIRDDYFAHEVDTTGICGYPFDVLTIAYDGKIALCCEDFAAELPLGRIEEGLEGVFQSPALKRVRRQFYAGSLDVCSGCNFFRHPRRSDIEAAKARIAALPDAARKKIVLAAE